MRGFEALQGPSGGCWEAAASSFVRSWELGTPRGKSKRLEPSDKPASHALLAKVGVFESTEDGQITSRLGRILREDMMLVRG